MKKGAILWVLFFLGVLFAHAEEGRVRVACVGDSITKGYELPDPHTNSYPAQLGRLLGGKWEVRNFGANGATMMKKGNSPYWQRPEYRAALDFKPDVVIIALGTNDSKAVNIEANPEDFTASYREMIAKFRAINPKVKIYAVLPPPVFSENDASDIRESRLAGETDLFPDTIHPNVEGATIEAQTAHAALTGQ